MNPDSYDSLEGSNTSSSEERNSLARRQQHHVRLMSQDNSILSTVHQQVLSNVLAMYRDTETEMTLCKWPLWYRETYFDGVPAGSLCS